MTSIKRSAAVPLSLVPALASLVACGPSNAAAADPCLPESYDNAVCDYAVRHQGYYVGGAWYPHIYAHPALFYYNGYSGYVRSGGRVRISEPAGASAGRSTVVRGGFGGIGSAHSFGGGS